MCATPCPDPCIARSIARRRPLALTIRAAWLEMDPRRIRPALSVQTAWNGCLGLIRGVRENGVTIEDHIREELDESGRLRDAGAAYSARMKCAATSGPWSGT